MRQSILYDRVSKSIFNTSRMLESWLLIVVFTHCREDFLEYVLMEEINVTAESKYQK